MVVPVAYPCVYYYCLRIAYDFAYVCLRISTNLVHHAPFTLGSSPFYILAYVCLRMCLLLPTYCLRMLAYLRSLTSPYEKNEHVQSRRNRTPIRKVFRAYPYDCSYDNKGIACVNFWIRTHTRALTNSM